MAPFGVEPEYVAIVDPDTLEPLERLERPALLALAARVGAIRLIDNVTLYPALRPVPNRSCDCTPFQPYVATSSATGHAAVTSQAANQREAQATCSA